MMIKSKTGEALELIAIDDWMIYASNENGDVFYASSEVWPEWLDFQKLPENMGGQEFRDAVLKILPTVRPSFYPVDAEHVQDIIDLGESQGFVALHA